MLVHKPALGSSRGALVSVLVTRPLDLAQTEPPRAEQSPPRQLPLRGWGGNWSSRSRVLGGWRMVQKAAGAYERWDTKVTYGGLPEVGRPRISFSASA